MLMFPLTIMAGSGLAPDLAWWKADGALFQDAAATTPANVAGNPIGAWPSTGSTRALTQTTATQRPLYQTVPKRVVFDGVDDRLSTASPIAATAAGAIILVFTTSATAFATRGVQAILSQSNSAAANAWFEVGIDAGGRLYTEFNNSGTIRTAVGSTVLANSTTYALLVSYDGTDYYMQLGPSEENPITYSNAGAFGWLGGVPAANTLTLGGTLTSAGLVRPFQGAVIEAQIYTTDITA